MNSAIYTGWVRHRRYQPKVNNFKYDLFLLSLDLDELNAGIKFSRLFAIEQWAILSFRHKDYLGGEGKLTRDKVWGVVKGLGGEDYHGRVTMLGQLRCFGLYFSPVNFYYCHDDAGELQYLLAEVSNTPWGERHCYLVEPKQNTLTDKVFHVSPFMDEEMHYRWRFTPLNPQLYLNIDNLNDDDDKLFDATIVMKQQELTAKNLVKNLIRIPAMTLKTVLGIHWEAVKLYLKGVPYVPYVKKQKEMI
jgi:DUF1365 family protein